MRRILWPILLAALASRPATAGIENAGTTGANFLSLGAGAGVLGMGGATLGGYADLTSASWNVASLGWMNESQLVFSHAPIAGGGAQDWVAYGGRMGSSPNRWSANALYQGDGSFDGRDAFGNPTGSFSASSMAFGGMFARSLNENVTVGLGGKVVSEKLGDASGFGGTFDAGVQVQRGALGFGIAAQNLGGRMKYGDIYYGMPTNLGVGVSYSNLDNGLRVALDYNHPSAYYDDMRAGVEWLWRGRVAVRTGYRHEMGGVSNDALNGPTFGMGAGVHGVWFDYGYQASSNGDAQQRIAIRISPRAWNGNADLGMSGADAGTKAATAERVAPAPKPTPAAPKSEPQVAVQSAPKTVTPAPKSEPQAAPQSTPKTVTPAPKSAAVAAAAAPTPTSESTAQKNAPAPKVEVADPKKAAPALAVVVPPAPAPTPKPVATKPAAMPAVTPPVSAAKPTQAPVTAPASPTAQTTEKPAAANATPATAAASPATAAPNPAPSAPTATAIAPVVPPASAIAKPSAPATAPATKRPDKVHVKSGETMMSIARQYETSVAAIMMENNLVSDQVKVGQVLKIPNHK